MSMIRFITAAASAIASVGILITPAAAQDAPWQDNNVFKLGVAYFALNDESSDVAGPNTPPGARVEVDDPTAATFTYTRHIGEQFGVEVIGGIPFGVDIQAGGSLAALGQAAEATVATVSVLGNYYFTPRSAKWRPYVGVGYNYTTFYDTEASPALNAALSGETDIALDDSTGVAAIVGINFAAGDNWLISGMVEYTAAETDVTLTTDTVVDMGMGPMSIGDIDRTTTVELNPFTYFLTVGCRF